MQGRSEEFGVEMMAKPTGEEALVMLLKHSKIPFHREFKFHPTRKWRFDFVIGDIPSMLKLAVEVEGGVYSKGRHTRGSGYSADCIKYNAAVINGWRVLRYTTQQINMDCIHDIEFLMK